MSWFDSIKKWFENLKNTNWLEIGQNWFESTKDWFGEIIEAAGKDDVIKKWAVIGGIVLAVVVAVVCLYKCCKCCCACICGRRRGRTMKAPGRDGLIIYRDPFERNPRDYFRRLRKKEPWDDCDGELLV
ncbi:hypothetical protein K1719_022784 [Acacia pycnantha]|nr:hypothetical protein K1719_022784 [Acacia pycnantha]